MKINCAVIVLATFALVTKAGAAASADHRTAAANSLNAEEKAVTGSGSTQAAAYQDAHSRLPAGKDASRETTKEVNGIWYCTLYYNG